MTKIETNLIKIKSGLEKAALAVASTMGAAGRPVIIVDEDRKIRFTKDGVSVAKSIKLEDPLEDIGAQIVISAANKTVEEVGDGTTTCSLLLYSFYNDFLKSGESPSVYIKKYDKEVERIIELIENKSIPVESLKQVKDIASISANSTKIGELFEDIYDKVGFDSMVQLENSRISTETYFEEVRGLEFDEGYLHPAFMTNKDTEKVEYENVYIHISTEPIKTIEDTELAKIINASIKTETPMLIIAPSYTDSVIRTLTMNKINSGLQIAAMQTPGYGYAVTKNMEDITAFLSEDNMVDRIVMSANKTIIYNEDTPNLEAHLVKLDTMVDNAIEEYDAMDYKNRYFKLKQSTAIIYVGGQTKDIQREEYDRVEDAIGSVTSAIKGGFSKGAGVALKEVGGILHSVISAPYNKILSNGGFTNTSVPINTKTGTPIKDFINEGIIDATPVIVNALRNSWASTKLLINTNYVVYNN